jgi:hypothetical protein
VLPEAKFIFIHRDGMDATASAMKRWRAKADLKYSLAKARFVPLNDMPRMAWRWIHNRLQQHRQGSRRLQHWGPIYAGMDDEPRDIPLEIRAARQWSRCVSRSTEQLRTVEPSRVCTVTYEEIVESPDREIRRIVDWLGLCPPAYDVSQAARLVLGGSVGRASRSLSAEVRRRIASEIREAERTLGNQIRGPHSG